MVWIEPLLVEDGLLAEDMPHERISHPDGLAAEEVEVVRRSRFQKLTEQSSFVRRTETGDFWFEVGPRDHHGVLSRRSTCAGSPARAILCRYATKCKKRAAVRAPSLSSELSPHRPLPTFVGHSRV